MLALTGGVHPLLDLGGGLCFGSLTKFVEFHRRHFHHDINAIQQRAGDAAGVLPHGALGAGATAAGVAVPAAFAGVHGANQHKFCRVGHCAYDPGNGHLAVFQGLAHHIQGVLAEFRQFIQEQYALVSHRDLAWAGIAAAAGQAGIGDGMVGIAEGTGCHQGLLGRQHTHHRIDLADLQGFLPGHIRQDTGQTLREHTLAGAGRPNEQHIMAAGGRHLQGTLHILLAHHILEVRNMEFLGCRHPDRLLRQLDFAVEGGDQLRHGVDAVDRRPTGQGCFCRILRGHKECLDAGLLRSQGHRQHTADRANGTLQAHLTDEGTGGARPAHRAGGGKDAQKNR